MGGTVEAQRMGVLGGTVRLPVILLAVSLLGVIGGAWLIGRWAVGLAIIADSLAVGAWAVWGYDDGKPPADAEALQVPGVWAVPAEERAFMARVRDRLPS